MLVYSVYSEAGGIGKTTLSGNLIEQHALNGHDVLAIDLDAQDASLTHLAGVEAPREDVSADNLLRHMIGSGKGDFSDLILESEFGFDIIPNHNLYDEFGDYIRRWKATVAENKKVPQEKINELDILRQTLIKNDIPEQYDVIVFDPPATPGKALYNSLCASQQVVVPFNPTPKGELSIEGLENLTDGLEDKIGTPVEIIAVVPWGARRNKIQREIMDDIDDLSYDTPVTIGDRAALFDRCWDNRAPGVHVLQEIRSRPPEREWETMEKLGELATHLEEGEGL